MFRSVVATVLAALLLTSGVPAADGIEVLTDEVVVQLYVQGMPEDEIIRRIEQSQVDFDLSDEMTEELRIAGITRKILDAMIARQAALNPVQAEPEASTEPAVPRLVVRLNPDRKPDSVPTVRALNAVDPKLSSALGIRAGDPTITDLGIALFCRTADHVPDHWRSKSPIGRDFNVPRHRMLVFVSGATVEPASKLRDSLSKLVKAQVWRESMADLELLTLEVPQELAVELEPGMAHDLSLALVMRIAERNYVALFDELDSVVLEETGGTTLSADLRSRSKNPLKALVKFEEPETD